MAKKIKVCKRCSGFDVKELKEFVPAKEYKVGCVGNCAQKCEQNSGTVFGELNGQLVTYSTKEEFFTKIKSIL